MEALGRPHKRVEPARVVCFSLVFILLILLILLVSLTLDDRLYYNISIMINKGELTGRHRRRVGNEVLGSGAWRRQRGGL